MCQKTSTTLTILSGMAMTVLALFAIHHLGMLGVALVGSILTTGILVTALVRSCACRRESSSGVHQEQDPAEVEDSPPSYEAVTAKPPPYYLLYASTSPFTDATLDTVISLGSQDHDHRKNILQHCTWTPPEPETSPPSFSQAMRFSFCGTTPDIGTTPPTSLASGTTTLHSPPDSGTATPPSPDSGCTSL